MFVKSFLKHLRASFLLLKKSKKGQGVLEAVLVIAIGVIITGLVFAPEIKTFCSNVMTDANTWYNTTMKPKIFPTS